MSYKPMPAAWGYRRQSDCRMRSRACAHDITINYATYEVVAVCCAHVTGSQL
jgi:hypothetical protein